MKGAAAIAKEERMQLHLPISGILAAGGPALGQMPKEVESALPEGFHWLEGNALVPGQAFAIWGKPSRPDDPGEVQGTVDKVFEAYREVREIWPWCTGRYVFHAPTGTMSILGTVFRSPQEMVVSSVTPLLAETVRRLAFTLTWPLVMAPKASLPQTLFQAAASRLSERDSPAPVSTP
jgi:hypothetical protein